MAWTSHEWTALSTGLGVVATATGAFFVWLQLSSSSTALYSSNSYTVQKDIIEATDRVSKAQDEILLQGNDRSKNATFAANLKRETARLDSLIETVQALRNNDGISKETWAHILWGLCPSFSKFSYKLGDANLDATRDACMQNVELWRVKPK